ncbi:MAG TPA: hypothetical protein VGL57_00985 [Solirubrobacteraceae bacterium]
MLLATLLLTLGAAAPASAGSTHKILETCANGQIPTGYSQQAYDQALKQMPPELSEYSDCSDLIHKAQLAAAAGSHGGGGSAGGTGGGGEVAPPTAAEQHALQHIANSAAAPVKVGGDVIHPGVVHVDIASALTDLPTPLLMLLAFLLACALLLVGRLILTRIRGRHREA